MKYILFVALIFSQSSHSSLSISNVPGPIKYGTIAILSEFIIKKMGIKSLSNDHLMRIQNLSNNDLERISTHFIQETKKKPYLMFNTIIHEILLRLPPVITIVSTRRAILQDNKNYSDCFYSAYMEASMLQECKTTQKRILYLAMESIPNFYFSIDQSAITLVSPNLPFLYTFLKSFLINEYLVFSSINGFDFMTLKERNYETLKQNVKTNFPDATNEEINQNVNEFYQTNQKKRNQYIVLLQSIKTAYFLSRISGLLKTPFPDVYALLPTHIKQRYTQGGTMKSRLAELLLGILQDVAYVCFIRSILYPSLEKIHDHLVNPTQQYLFKKYSEISHTEINLTESNLNRLLSYIASGIILFYASDKILQLLHQKGIICMETAVHV